MSYTPVTGVWEVTMGCNMQCKHCGSSCLQPLPDELTTEEALDLCDQIAHLGLRWITLSGGEPLIRRDWDQLVRRLRERGVVPNLITNGWLCDQKTLVRAKASGIGTMAISLDGLEETHDFMRKPGSFARAMRALELMRQEAISSGVITTVSKRNLTELDALANLLIERGVRYWQLQIGLPMGNFARQPELILSPAEVDAVIDFAHRNLDNDRIAIYPADCIGYYSHKDLMVRQQAHRSAAPPLWKGCNAGKRSLGILHNGEILGCTSIRDRKFIEGSVRKRSLRAIWEDRNAFAWNRALRKSDLQGHCKTCQYGDLCLGGCPNTRLTMKGSIYAENEYCSYHVALRKAESRLDESTDAAELIAVARRMAQKGELQLAGMALARAMKLDPENLELLRLYGYVSFALNNLPECRTANEQVLARKPDDAYATKGLGLALHRLGETERGIEHLRRAVERSPAGDLDAYHDLAMVYLEVGRRDEARMLVDQARRTFPQFMTQDIGLLQALCA